MKRFGWFFVVAWTLVIGLVLYWEFQRGQAATREIAVGQARAHFNKDVAFRLWATAHGRVYVPVTDKMQPNPNMAHIEERDLTTPSGRQLTLINPAGMIHQLNDQFGELYGVAGRITSLHPLEEENRADPWERSAIQAFASGSKEVMEFGELNGEPVLRLMRPLLVTPGCLGCHTEQSYSLGGISGGVGVSIPMRELLIQEQKRLFASSSSLAILWLVGLLLMQYTFRQLSRNQQKRQEALEELARSEMRKSSIMESALDSIITMDHRGYIVEFNPAAENAFGYSRSQVVGRELAEMLIPPSLRELHRSGLTKYITRGTTRMLGTRIKTMAMRSDGREFPVELTVTRIELEEQPMFTAYVRDMTEAHQLEEQISFQSTHDTLTGLFNRAEFERRLKLLLNESRFNSDHYAVAILDVDQFKVINDTCGHDAGDVLLTQLARLLYTKMGAGDTLARLGGDEFGLLLEHCTIDQAERLASELLQSVKDFRFLWEERSFNISASIGVVPVVPRTQTLSDVLSAADTACYVAKEQGRNRLHLFRHDDVDLARRQGEMRWVSRIHDAFENGRFSLYYQQLQPLREEPDEDGWHYEILIRMRDERGEFVPPVTFLSAAERYSLMPTIDRWVVRSTFSWLAANPRHLEQLVMCSINLSGHSLTDSSFQLFLTEQLKKFQLPASRICFEITETAVVSNLAKAARFIETLKQHGCRFALDDFGSGMSSFAYLKNLPVDFLKIDGAFVRDIMEDEIDFAMVRSINDIGHVMGKKTIAEFVENSEIMTRLKEIGVDYAQGYGVAMPAPLEQISPIVGARVEMVG